MLSDILITENVMLQVAYADKLAAHAERAAEQRDVSKTAILTALQRREPLGSSAIGGGIALPHATIDGLVAPFAVLAILAAPIDFSSNFTARDDQDASRTTGGPVDLVFLLLTPPGTAGAHLRALSAVARRLRTFKCARRFATYSRCRGSTSSLIVGANLTPPRPLRESHCFNRMRHHLKALLI